MKSLVFLLLLAGVPVMKAGAVEDIEFVAEHLSEVPMDNRFATLPLWSATAEATPGWTFVGQVGYADTTVGNLQAAGPLLSVATSRPISPRWNLGLFVFYDRLSLTGNHDERPLQTKFAPDTPFARPVNSEFNNLDGWMNHYGAGLRMTFASGSGRLSAVRWVGGILWQRVELRDYRLDYELLEGDDAGTTGQIDFDADYTHYTPFIGFEIPREGARWAMTPHMLAAWPNPRRGVVGHITGPGFDLRGDQEQAGAGTHFGDPSITLGFDVTYLPAHLTVDVGTLVTQALVEPVVHKGIDTNWVISCLWRF